LIKHPVNAIIFRARNEGGYHRFLSYLITTKFYLSLKEVIQLGFTVGEAEQHLETTQKAAAAAEAIYEEAKKAFERTERTKNRKAAEYMSQKKGEYDRAVKAWNAAEVRLNNAYR
jgi:hypothetical protein